MTNKCGINTKLLKTDDSFRMFSKGQVISRLVSCQLNWIDNNLHKRRYRCFLNIQKGDRNSYPFIEHRKYDLSRFSPATFDYGQVHLGAKESA